MKDSMNRAHALSDVGIAGFSRRQALTSNQILAILHRPHRTDRTAPDAIGRLTCITCIPCIRCATYWLAIIRDPI